MAGADRYCFAYYANAAIENPGNPFDDIEPQIPAQDPFVNSYAGYPLFLVQDSELVDAGCMTIEQAPYLIAMTTTFDGSPDTSTADT